MKFLKKLRSSNFWVSMISAVVLILQAVFDVTIKAEYLTQIIMAILGLLVMSGIISDSSNSEVTVNQSANMEEVKQSIIDAFTQASATFQTCLESVVKQFEADKLNMNANAKSQEEYLNNEEAKEKIEINTKTLVENTQTNAIVENSAPVENIVNQNSTTIANSNYEDVL